MNSKHILKDVILCQTSKTEASTYKITWCQNQENYNLNTQCSENLKTCIIVNYFNIYLSQQVQWFFASLVYFLIYIYINIWLSTSLNQQHCTTHSKECEWIVVTAPSICQRADQLFHRWFQASTTVWC